MRTLKNLADFQNENQTVITELQMAEVVGGRGQADCICYENWPTSGGDNDHWEYNDTDNGKKFLSHNGSLQP